MKASKLSAEQELAGEREADSQGQNETVWFKDPVPVEYGAKAIAYDPAFDLVLIVTVAGHWETHELVMFTSEHRTAIMNAEPRP